MNKKYKSMECLANVLLGVGFLSLVAGILFFILFLYCLGGSDWGIPLLISIGCIIEGFMSFVFAEVLDWMVSLGENVEAIQMNLKEKEKK